MTVGAFGPKGHDHLRPMAAKAAHQVAQEPFLDPLDLFDFLQRAIRVVEYFQEGDAQLTGSVAKLELAHIGQLAEVAGRSPVPEPGAAARHGDRADPCPRRAVASERRGAANA